MIYPIISRQQYEADRNVVPFRPRAVTLDEAEQRAIFLLKREAEHTRHTDVWQMCAKQLAQSKNAAIACEARRLMAQP